MAQTAEILEALPPAQMQPTGLAQFDLTVTATPLVITWDKDAVSTLLIPSASSMRGWRQEADARRQFRRPRKARQMFTNHER